MRPLDAKGFSLWARAVFLAAVLLFAFHASTHMVAAGDTWVALACGRHFYNHGVDTVEPFSANSHPPGPTDEELAEYPAIVTRLFSAETIRYWHPTGWINQNWGTHWLFYWLTNASPFADADAHSYNALVYWKFALYMLTALAVYFSGRVLGANAFLSAIAAAAAMFIGRTFLDIRPAGFSNFFTAVFLLILALALRRDRRCIWLVVPLLVVWANMHGGYIYVLLAMPLFIAGQAAATLVDRRGKWFNGVGWGAVIHSTAATGVAAIAMVLFNPFRLTNLTHTFIISLSDYAEEWRQVNEWHGGFQRDNPVGSSDPFIAMFAALLVIAAAWTIIITAKPYGRKVRKKTDTFDWPKIDLGVLAVTALTVYLAVKSRRFIPVAAYVACPLMALMVDQVADMVRSLRNRQKSGRCEAGEWPAGLRNACTLLVLAVALAAGSWWGYKFKKTYLEPFPLDRRYSSVFMRMTASYLKPFEVMDFIRENRLSGNMFNYWTEGGAIAYGQEGDPETGFTPLKLFMDGRAQAAYNIDVYHEWITIANAGPMGVRVQQRILRQGGRPTAREYELMGDYIDGKMKEYDVWIILLPATEFGDRSKPFYEAIRRHNEWRTVYYDGRQMLIARVTDPRGAEIFNSAMYGDAIFPDEYSKELTRATWFLAVEDREYVERGLGHIERALERHFAAEPLQILALAYRPNMVEHFGERANDIARESLETWRRNKDIYREQDGYRTRMIAAVAATDRLRVFGREEDKRSAAVLRGELIEELRATTKWTKW